jgi:hypothetical protein
VVGPNFWSMPDPTEVTSNHWLAHIPLSVWQAGKGQGHDLFHVSDMGGLVEMSSVSMIMLLSEALN